MRTMIRLLVSRESRVRVPDGSPASRQGVLASFLGTITGPPRPSPPPRHHAIGGGALRLGHGYLEGHPSTGEDVTHDPASVHLAHCAIGRELLHAQPDVGG